MAIGANTDRWGIKDAYLAAAENDPEILRRCADGGVNLNESYEESHLPINEETTRDGGYPLVQTLLGSSCPSVLTRRLKWKPVHIAAKTGSQNAFEFLLTHRDVQVGAKTKTFSTLGGLINFCLLPYASLESAAMAMQTGSTAATTVSDCIGSELAGRLGSQLDVSSWSPWLTAAWATKKLSTMFLTVDDKTCAHLAAEEGHVNILESLYAARKLDVLSDVDYRSQRTFLHAAAERDQRAVFEWADSKVELRPLFHTRTDRDRWLSAPGDTVAHSAAMHGAVSVLDYLNSKGDYRGLLSAPTLTEKKNPPLHCIDRLTILDEAGQSSEHPTITFYKRVGLDRLQNAFGRTYSEEVKARAYAREIVGSGKSAHKRNYRDSCR